MVKTPTRLSAFEIPRESPVVRDVPPPAVTSSQPSREFPAASVLAVPELPPEANPPPQASSTPSPAVPRPIPRPEEEPRRQIGARVRLSVAERLRTALFVTRESQQDAVEQALDDWLRSRDF